MLMHLKIEIIVFRLAPTPCSCLGFANPTMNNDRRTEEEITISVIQLSIGYAGSLETQAIAPKG